MRELDSVNSSESLITSHDQDVNQLKELDEESYAVLMAAIYEEIRQPLDKFKIVEIREI